MNTYRIREINYLFNVRSRSNSSVRKTSQGGNRRDERTAALRAVRDLAGTGSRTQSPVRSGGSSRNSPVSGTQTPVEPSVSPNPTPGVDMELSLIHI